MHCKGSPQPPRCFRPFATGLPSRRTGPTCTSRLVVNRRSFRGGHGKYLRGGSYHRDPDYQGIETTCGEPLRNNIGGTTTPYLEVHAAQGRPIGRVHLASRGKRLTPRETVRNLHRGSATTCHKTVIYDPVAVHRQQDGRKPCQTQSPTHERITSAVEAVPDRKASYPTPCGFHTARAARPDDRSIVP